MADDDSIREFERMQQVDPWESQYADELELMNNEDDLNGWFCPLFAWIALSSPPPILCEMFL